MRFESEARTLAAGRSVPSGMPDSRRFRAALTVSVLAHALALGPLLRAESAPLRPVPLTIEVALIDADAAGGCGESASAAVSGTQTRGPEATQSLSTLAAPPALKRPRSRRSFAVEPTVLRLRRPQRSPTIARPKPMPAPIEMAAPVGAATGLEDLADSAGFPGDEAGGRIDAIGLGSGGGDSTGRGDAIAGNGIGGDAGGAGLGGERVAYGTNPLPSYPLAARRRGMEGLVMLDVVVAPDGSAADVRVSRSSGFALLDDAAATTVRKRWRFLPARRDGVPVERRVSVPIRFRLEDARG